MSNSTAIQTYQTTTNREDLSDVITNISPEETPFYTLINKETAANTYHEWNLDTLANASSTNAAIEGADYTFSRKTMPTRTGAYTQIFQNPFEVSDTQRKVNTAGMSDAYAYQGMKAMKEQKRDIEKTLLSTNAGASGASGTARQLKGALSWVTTNVSTSASNRALTEAIFNQNLQDVWNQGGMVDRSFVNGSQKRAISAFTAGNTRNVDATRKALVNSIAVYESDFGNIDIVLDRYMDANGALDIQTDLWAVATLREMENVPVAKVGSATRGVIECEKTLVCRQQLGNGYVQNLT